MINRIKSIIEAENLTPARFADNLDIGRAVISHILNGRNKPSLEVITRILAKMPQINSDWLLTGNGSMYKDEVNIVNSSQPSLVVTTNNNQLSASDLFSQDLFASENVINEPVYTDLVEEDKEIEVKTPQDNIQKTVTERIIYREKAAKKISKIIIYYTDNTFESFNAENEPL
ncbi:XRE family transcriptional regulator [Dysgonomonas sp. 216]|uniref:helix-turn-helix domain-containing protein n=1 Tax=Dysgonomonas sp. 216 TaxID=2302934 RepID=UPI0013D1D4C5|nr:helix-turn-helix transcriptional regulator [Dysgonomonas sp. 216]NDW17928.1 XRE family transcriptional regulator [Dysgonomonas sp. 216]